MGHGVSNSLAPMEGPQRPPSEIKESAIFDPILLYSICYLVYLGVTCKKSASGEVSKTHTNIGFGQNIGLKKFGVCKNIESKKNLGSKIIFG